jgi:hypothetical protein
MNQHRVSVKVEHQMYHSGNVQQPHVPSLS